MIVIIYYADHSNLSHMKFTCLLVTQEYVKDLKTALAREDGDQLQQCLSIDPNIIPGGQRLLTTTFTNVRLL